MGRKEHHSLASCLWFAARLGRLTGKPEVTTDQTHSTGTSGRSTERYAGSFLTYGSASSSAPDIRFHVCTGRHDTHAASLVSPSHFGNSSRIASCSLSRINR